MFLRRAETAAELQMGSPRQSVSTLTFDEIYETHVDFLWRNAKRLGIASDAVEDVLQQVFLVVHRRFSQVMIAGSERAWLFAILVRVAKDHRRSLKRKSPHHESPTVDPETLPDDKQHGPHETLARIEAAFIVERLLDALTDEKREVFILAELEGMTAKEIGEATGANIDTVYSRLRTARLEFEEAAARYRLREERRT